MAKLLNKNQAIEIDINYGSDGNGGSTGNEFWLNYFTITDTKGNVYTFDQKEILTSAPVTQLNFFDGTFTTTGANEQITSTNAWHLSKIESSNGMLLASLDYVLDYVQYTTSVSRTDYEIINRDSNYNATISDPTNANLLKPKSIISHIASSGNTQKLSKITFNKDGTSIHFGLDQVTGNPETGSSALKTIAIKDKNNIANKTFTLDYEISASRLWLMNVQEQGGSLTNDYTLEYNNKSSLPAFDSPSDDWGYNDGTQFTMSTSNCTVATPYYDHDAITTGLLRKITYPTGGEKEFIFEQNTISYEGSDSPLFPNGRTLSDDEYRAHNPDNWDFDTFSMSYTGNAVLDYQLFGSFTTTQSQEIIFKSSSITIQLLNGNTSTVQEVLDNSLIKLYDGNGTEHATFYLGEDETRVTIPAGTYTAKLFLFDINVHFTINSCLAYNKYATNIKKFVYGGGVRIKEILFNNDAVTATPSRKTFYAYTDANNTINDDKSSGSIDGNLGSVVREYDLATSPYLCTPSNDPTYRVRTKIPNTQLSQGSYVGYKTVRVSEYRNGSRVLTYTSAQDYASPRSTFEYPYTPAPTIDYKRGLLLSEVVYAEPESQLLGPLGLKLKETTNIYELEKEQEALAYALYSIENSTKQFFDVYTAYTNQTPDQYPGCNPAPTQLSYTDGYNGVPFFILRDTIFSTRAKLKEKTVKDIFYDANEVASETETKQTFVYNSINHQVSEQRSIYNEGGSEKTLMTKYYYPVGGVPANYDYTPTVTKLITLNKINEVLAIETYQNDVKRSQVNNLYYEFETNLVIPQKVQTSKENDTAEDRVQFHAYDSYGNPLELSKADGTRIMYVWGYDNSYPIAKITNHSYDGISAGLQNAIDDAISASNSDMDAASENTLRTKLDLIRTHTDLQTAQVSTLTYDPLVGVTSMTDARGYTMFYKYDDFNRLQEVKDQDNYILSQNDYYYGTPNYVKTTAFQVKTLDAINNAVSSQLLTDDEKLESITYLDGLGRPIQTIAKQAGGNKQDIISPTVYDAFGRQALEYLPYADPDQVLGTANLNYRDHTQLLLDLEAYYVIKYPEDQLTPTTINAYSEKVFEPSPLNRVLEQAAPGSDWLVDEDSDADHTIKIEYQTNGFEEVKLFKVIFPNIDTEQPQLYHEGWYAANELYKTITKDENWQPNQTKPAAHTTEEFKDKRGRLILKRNYNTKGDAHDTYYTYDDFGNLSYVFSPKGSDLILNSIRYSRLNETINYLEFIPLDKYGDPIISGGSGQTTVVVDDITNELYITFDLNFDSAIDLRTGPIYLLSSTLPNMIIGTITTGGVNYVVSIQDGYLFIAGSGALTTLSSNMVVDLPDYSINTGTLDDLCYQYRYDYRNRLVEKKIPQKTWEYIVYDKLDRPTLTQDANLRTENTWLFAKYDAFDRIVYTGNWQGGNSRTGIQNTANNDTVINEVATSSPLSLDNTTVHYTNNAFPVLTSQSAGIHTVNYYDGYNTELSAVFADPGTVFGQTTTSNTKSLPTAGKVRVLGTNDWVTTVTYFDDKAQPVYIGSENDYLNTTDVLKSELDFIGKLLKTENSHIKDPNAAIVVTDTFSYDHTGRLLSQKQLISGQAEELIVKNEYDALGQLVSKGIGSIEASPLQTVDYSYNVRGWLTSINDMQALGTDLFSFAINYNTTALGLGNDALYNGNISETLWKTTNDIAGNTSRGYAYDYDALNRLESASMAIDTGSNFALAAGYHVNGLQYDKNGNMVRLQRTGITDMFDNLTYIYNGNQLETVTDAVSNQQTEGFIDGNTAGTDYSYDANGNMIEDKNKGISSISYNHLNLPTLVDFGGGNSIAYVYDATGIKLKKTVTETGVNTSTVYAGNYIYEINNATETLQLFSQPEGYVEPDGSGGYNYVYQYKDHLGNIRLAYHLDDANSVIIQEDYATSTYDWSSATNGNVTINNNNEVFNINLKNKWNSTSKYVNFTPGQSIHIEFDFENVDMVSPRLYVSEQISGVGNREVIVIS